MPGDGFLSYDALIRELGRLCQEGCTGTLFIATSDNHALRVVLQRGEITHVIARGQIGMAAVASIKQVAGGRVTYSDTVIDGGMPHSLPPTAELLAMLGESERTVGAGVDTAPLLASLDQGRAIIESELAECLGPMAAMVYEEVVARIGHVGGPTTFKATIDQLGDELRHPAKADRFKDRVRSRLAAAAIKTKS
jgi:hypothetical protein